jgi:putative transposase
MVEPPEKHRKRRKVYNTPYHAHFLTFSCFKRQAFFSGELAPRWFLESLDTARRATPFSLWAFVIMPEHVHLVIAPGETYDISRILARIKRPVTTKAVDHVRRTQPAFLRRMTERRPGGRVTRRFWKPGGGYDRNLWTPEEIHKTIRYVHDNPVRRGLVEKPQDWPWTSYRTWTGEDPEPLPLDLEHVPTVMT